MNEYNVEDYNLFDEAISTTNTFKNNLDSVSELVNESKNIIGNQSVFMGPIQENCMEVFGKLNTSLDSITTNFTTMASFLDSANTSYKNGDKNASNLILSTDSSGNVITATASELSGSNNTEQVWNYLISKGFSPAGAAGIMGNLVRESGLIAGNVQNGMGYSDEAYVNGIKNGTISREQFINDSRGFGIAQWTYSTRKAALYDALGPENIDNLSMQLDFMCNEMGGNLRNSMMNATSPAAAANEFHNVYERSADRTTANRQNSAVSIYNQYVA